RRAHGHRARGRLWPGDGRGEPLALRRGAPDAARGGGELPPPHRRRPCPDRGGPAPHRARARRRVGRRLRDAHPIGLEAGHDRGRQRARVDRQAGGRMAAQGRRDRAVPGCPGTELGIEERRPMKGLMRWILGMLLRLVALGFLGWGALALHFAGPEDLADLLAVAWVVLGLAVLILVRPLGRCILTFVAAAAVLLVWWSTIRPSNDRNWQADVARLPRAELAGDRLTLYNVR